MACSLAFTHNLERKLKTNPPIPLQCWETENRNYTTANTQRSFFLKPFCFQIQLYKGFGVEVLCCTSPMKRCHCNSSSDNSLGVTNLLA